MEALSALVARLPADFPAALFVVLHIAPHSPSALPRILSRASALPAVHPEDGEVFRPGHIYIAPPDHHLLIDGDRVAVKKGPRENRFRPSVDALFRSAAYTHGAGVIGVVLSGLLDDGTSGLWTIKRLGGTALVQDPAEALFDPMPRSALQHVQIDAVLPASEIAGRLVRLVQAPRPEAPAPGLTGEERERLRAEVPIAAKDSAYRLGIMALGKLSPFTCPECQGVLVQVEEGTLTRFRCHTGHAYTADALLADLTEATEAQAYQVIRGLEETALLLRQLSGRFEETGEPQTARAFLEQACRAERRTETLRSVIFQNEPLSEEKLEATVQRD
ncbi:CheY-like receiver domain/methylesterase domain-containing chemotaxis response regulator [Deinococcus phoenicis]|uniref:protein-glutamate methylesterase n=1 Tax=Deinococcus phoenicis TaxID=1476583 RepID=A0A016QTL3_9DEIO|nr:CheY-like receiver domain/methylesterase domain-containing chemotaxis response regulator [Deinococcus phoenicis]